MKFEVDAADLNRLIAEPSRIAVRAMRITAAPGQISVLADDKVVRLEQRTSAVVHEHGTITVPPALFHDLAKTMPAGPVTVAAVGRIVELHGHGDPDDEVDDATHHSLWQVNADDDEIPLPPDEPPVIGEVDMAAFDRSMSQVLPALSGDMNRPTLCAVSVRPASGRLAIAATDSYRLHVTRSEMVDAAGWANQALIPGEAIRLATSVFGSDDAVLALDRGHMMIRSENATLTARLVQGDFPDYQTLIPKPRDASTHIIIDSAKLLEALGRVAVVAKHKLGMSRVVVSAVPEEKLVVVEATGADLGQSSVNVHAIQVKGSGFRFAADIRYLTAAVKAAGAERLELFWTREGEPVLVSGFGDPAYQAVVMPLHTTATTKGA